jgi:tetraacyldisaccharide 4'-kinase
MDYLQNVISGKARGPAAAALRAAASIAEPIYAAGMSVRNRLFDAGVQRIHDLGRPTIAIGNLTAGGTGKTPMVRWLADRLRSHGRHVAILARGYRSVRGELGDEQRMLDAALNLPGLARVELVADPDRCRGAAFALEKNPQINLFILDDAFQHRRVRRDLDVVLISAPEPFGFDHVLPRGLLREPMSGLRRAGAIVLTHCDQVSVAELAALERRIRAYNADAPVYRAVHAHIGLKRDDGASTEPIELLNATPFFAFAGIGAPGRLDQQLKRWGDRYRGARWFPDHFAYDEPAMNTLQSAARAAGAEVLVTTEKDWVKLGGREIGSRSLPIWRIEMSLQFTDDGDSKLWKQISGVIL